MLLQNLKQSQFLVGLHSRGPQELNKGNFKSLACILAEIYPFEFRHFFKKKIKIALNGHLSNGFFNTIEIQNTFSSINATV